ncbi:MAG: hypothetical protein M3P46_05115, partial [Actinomycetota bacterium]|nr:hypothetical protein [Actinomycetota bacterium]
DTRGNTWTRDADTAPNGGVNQRTVVFSAHVATALQGGDSLTFTVPANEGAVAVTAEWSGIAATGPSDGSAVSTGTGTTPSASLTTTSAPDLVLGVLGATGGTTLAAQAPSWTAATGGQACSGNTSVSTLAAYRLPFTPSSMTYNPTLSVSTNYAVAVVAYKAQ